MPGLIRIIGDISITTFEGFSKRLSVLERDGEPIVIELYSEGGDPIAGLAYASRIRSSASEITVIATGEVASSAVIILAAGDRRLMYNESWVMVHESSDELKGNVVELEGRVSHLRRLEHQWCTLLANVSNITDTEWMKLHKETTYLDAQQCLRLGLVNGII